MRQISTTLVRTVFLPAGSPPIGSIDHIQADLSNKDIFIEHQRMYCRGDLDVMVDYTSFPLDRGSHIFPEHCRPEQGRAWQALLNIPFALSEDIDCMMTEPLNIALGDINWFMVAPQALEMEVEILISGKEIADAPKTRENRQKKDGGWHMVSVEDMEREKASETGKQLSWEATAKDGCEKDDNKSDTGPMRLISLEPADSAENSAEEPAASAVEDERQEILTAMPAEQPIPEAEETAEVSAAAVEEKAVVAEEKAAVMEEKEAKAEEKPVVAEEKPVVAEEKPVVAEEMVLAAEAGAEETAEIPEEDSGTAQLKVNEQPAEVVRIVFREDKLPNDDEIAKAIEEAKAEKAAYEAKKAADEKTVSAREADVTGQIDAEADSVKNEPADNADEAIAAESLPGEEELPEAAAVMAEPAPSGKPKKKRRSFGLPRLDVDAQNNNIEISAFNINIKLPGMRD